MNHHTRRKCGVAAIGLLLFAGCLTGCSRRAGPDYELAQVTGTVEMDGKPLGGAEVVFTPTGAGSMSFGTTNEAGEYKLFHNVGAPGCGLGEHLVSINKMGEPGGPDDTVNLIPARYNLNTTFTANVQSGENHFDFDLQSKGK